MTGHDMILYRSCRFVHDQDHHGLFHTRIKQNRLTGYRGVFIKESCDRGEYIRGNGREE